jgi:hypothetical protein
VSTSVECEINNFGAGGSDMQVASGTQSGPTAVATGGPVAWPFLPVSICVTSSTTSGSGTQSNPRQCRPPDVSVGGPPSGCAVNLGSCDPSSSCTVNLGTCHNGGACTINAGDCGSGGTALICLNAKCGGGPGKSFTGFGCGFASDNDDTGVINNDPKKQTGAFEAGPWAVYDQEDPSNFVTDVTITCTVQVNNPNQGGGGVSRSNITSGNVGVLADTISYYAQPTDTVYVCTRVEWNSPKGHEVVESDADNDSSNGHQCDMATSTEAAR